MYRSIPDVGTTSDSAQSSDDKDEDEVDDVQPNHALSRSPVDGSWSLDPTHDLKGTWYATSG
jgi:hypothetical protein